MKRARLFFLQIILFFSATSHAKLSPSTLPSESSENRQQSSDLLIERCIAGIVASRPQLASQAQTICEKVFAKSSTPSAHPTEYSGRTMADCLQLFRTFPSVTRADAQWACSHIVSLNNEAKSQKYAESPQNFIGLPEVAM